MGFILRVIVGLGIVAVGVYIVIKTRSFEGFFGVVPWAENHLGPGGTMLFYKLLGIVIILVGFIVATNLWNAFLQATLGSIVPAPTY